MALRYVRVYHVEVIGSSRLSLSTNIWLVTGDEASFYRLKPFDIYQTRFIFLSIFQQTSTFPSVAELWGFSHEQLLSIKSLDFRVHVPYGMLPMYYEYRPTRILKTFFIYDWQLTKNWWLTHDN